MALLSGTGAQAQAPAAPYPNKPVRVVVAFTAGSATDMIARSVGQQLADKLKQSFVIDNKSGAPGLKPTTSPTRASMRSTICWSAGCNSCSPLSRQ